jgi:hypothetical protein
MSLLSLLAFGLLCWLSCAATAGAADPSPAPTRIWSGLVLATNPAHPAQPPEPLRKFASKLKNIFGYNQFELVGEYSEKMDDPSERWLLPSKDFYLSVKTRNLPAQHYPMDVVLFQNRRRLAEFETHLSPESPLFIRGPLYAGGQLVIVLRVADASEFPVRPAPKPPFVVLNPSPFSPVPPPREKEHPVTAAILITPPKARIIPLPADHSFGPLPPGRPGPGPADRFGPMSGDRPGGPGDIDQKFGKP